MAINIEDIDGLTGNELNEYFRTHLEIGDVVDGVGGLKYRVIAGPYGRDNYWVIRLNRHTLEDDSFTPVTMSVQSMDLIRVK